MTSWSSIRAILPACHVMADMGWILQASEAFSSENASFQSAVEPCSRIFAQRIVPWLVRCLFKFYFSILWGVSVRITEHIQKTYLVWTAYLLNTFQPICHALCTYLFKKVCGRRIMIAKVCPLASICRWVHVSVNFSPKAPVDARERIVFINFITWQAIKDTWVMQNNFRGGRNQKDFVWIAAL